MRFYSCLTLGSLSLAVAILIPHQVPAYAGSDVKAPVISTAITGTAPSSVSLSYDNRQAYVANYESGSLTVIDLESGVVNQTVKLDGKAEFVATDPRGEYIYVTYQKERYAGELAILETSSLQVVKRVQLQGRPLAISVTTDGSRAYIADARSAVIYVVNLDSQLLQGVAVSGRYGPYDLQLSNDEQILYVSNWGGGSRGSVSFIRTDTLDMVQDLPLGSDDASMMGISPNGLYLYVLSESGKRVWVLNTQTRTVDRFFRLEGTPSDIAVSTDGSFLAITLFDRRELALIESSTGRIIKTVPLPSNPTGVALYDLSGRALTIGEPRYAGQINLDTSAPRAPRNVRVRVEGQQVRVTWSPPIAVGGPRIKDYLVTTTPPSRGCSATSLSCKPVGLRAGIRYKFSVQARSDGGLGPRSASRAATVPRSTAAMRLPRAPVPAVPSRPKPPRVFS